MISIDSIENIDSIESLKKQELSPQWKLDVLKRQVLTSVERIGEYRGILHSRRHLAASPLFKGIPNFRETRIRMLRAETVAELFDIMDSVPLPADR